MTPTHRPTRRARLPLLATAQINLTAEAFHVPQYEGGPLFTINDVHLITGELSADGTTLQVHCANGTIPDWTIETGTGVLKPLVNSSGREQYIDYESMTTSLNLTGRPVFASGSFYYNLDAKTTTGRPATNIEFFYTEKAGGAAYKIGDLAHGIAVPAPPPPPPPPPDPPPINMTAEPFYVKEYHSDLMKLGDVHLFTGSVDASGGQLTVHCVNGTVPDYTIDVGPGVWGPKHGAGEVYYEFDSATTTLSYLNFSVTSKLKLYENLDAADPFGRPLTDLQFFITEPGFSPEVVGELRHVTSRRRRLAGRWP